MWPASHRRFYGKCTEQQKGERRKHEAIRRPPALGLQTSALFDLLHCDCTDDAAVVSTPGNGNKAPGHSAEIAAVRGPALRCVLVCTHKTLKKAKPFSVARPKMDLPFRSHLAYNRLHGINADPLGECIDAGFRGDSHQHFSHSRRVDGQISSNRLLQCSSTAGKSNVLAKKGSKSTSERQSTICLLKQSLRAPGDVGFSIDMHK